MDALGLECVYLHDSPERPQAGIDLFYFLRDHLLGKSTK
jgi:hypothetical protein